LDFSAESSLLASGSADQSVRIWDVSQASGDQKKKIIGADEPQPNEEGQKDSSPELLRTFYTKQTSVFTVKFSRRNLLLAGGPFAKTESE